MEKLTIKRILSYLRPFKKEFILAGLLLAVATAIGFLQPLVIRQITDGGMLAQNLPELFWGVAALALLVLLNQGAEMAQTRLFVNVHNRSYYTIFQEVFHKLLRLRKSYFEDKNNAEILSCLQMDVSQVASITDRYTVMSVSYVFRIISGLVGLLMISWKLTLIVLAMSPLKVLLVRRLSGKLQKDSAMIDAWNTLWETLLEWSVTILLYLVGGLLICQGGLTIGSVFAFVSYSWYVTGPVSALLNLKMYFARILPSAKRLFRFLDMESEQDQGKDQPKGRALGLPPRLEFKDVAFSYQADRQILRGASFCVEPGEKVAIVGANGSGKSTILNLLLRFYTPDAGEITADGVPVSQLSLAGYRSLFSVVSQEPYLFLGDIAGNIDLTGRAPAGSWPWPGLC